MKSDDVPPSPVRPPLTDCRLHVTAVQDSRARDNDSARGKRDKTPFCLDDDTQGMKPMDFNFGASTQNRILS
jgi:hypothetical protein